MLLSALAILLVNLAFIVCIIKYRYEVRLILIYSAFMFFNAALYFRRRLLHHWPAELHRHHLRPWLRRRQRQWLRCGLGYAAILLGAFIMFSFICNFSPSSNSMPPSLRAGVCLGLLAVGEYFFYCLLVLHLDVEEEAMQMHVHAQV
jgi:hypothetical protein